MRYLFLVACLLGGCGDDAPAPTQPSSGQSALDALKTLPKTDAAYINTHLPGVVLGPSTTTPPLTNADAWLPLKAGTMTFLTPGPHGKKILNTLHATDREPGMPVGSKTGGWSLGLPDNSVHYLRQTPGKGIELPTVVSHKEGLITRLNPPEPVVLEGQAKNTSAVTTIKVRVYDLHEPAVLAHSGELTCTWTDLGGWNVKVPMGTYDTRLVHMNAKGTIGPADVDVNRYLFLAKGIGVVAFIREHIIAALLVYHHDRADVGVLQSIDHAKTSH